MFSQATDDVVDQRKLGLFIFLITAVTGLTQTIFYLMHSVWKLSTCNLFLSKFFCIHKNVQMTPKQCKRSSGNFQKLLKMTKN